MAMLLLVVIFIMYIGLGIPDSLFGTAWPAVYAELAIPVEAGRYVTALISGGTIVSSLNSAWLLKKYGTGKVTFVSVLLTVAGLYGFSKASSMTELLLSAIPMGLGAGAIDTGLNHYVALHYKASQVNFLHCFYGIGVTLSPFLMSMALAGKDGWRGGYQKALLFQAAIALLSFITLPLWKMAEKNFSLKTKTKRENDIREEMSVRKLVRQKTILFGWMIFFCTCAIEFTCGAWGSTFLVETGRAGVEKAAELTMFYYAGMAVGRGISGFLVTKMTEWKIIFTGQLIVGSAIILLLFPASAAVSGAALFCIGLGNGPLFPNLTYLTPANYGIENAGIVIGTQAVVSNLGILLAPFLFGLLIPVMGAKGFPWYLLALFGAMGAATAGLVFRLKGEGRYYDG